MEKAFEEPYLCNIKDSLPTLMFFSKFFNLENKKNVAFLQWC